MEAISLYEYFNQVIVINGKKITVDWRRIKEDTESDDPQLAIRGRKATKKLVFLKVLTPVREKSWSFDDPRMNPYLGPDKDYPTKDGRVFFVRKKDAINYGRVNWKWRMDNWVITNGKKKLTRLGIC